MWSGRPPEFHTRPGWSSSRVAIPPALPYPRLAAVESTIGLPFWVRTRCGVPNRARSNCSPTVNKAEVFIILAKGTGGELAATQAAGGEKTLLGSGGFQVQGLERIANLRLDTPPAAGLLREAGDGKDVWNLETSRCPKNLVIRRYGSSLGAVAPFRDNRSWRLGLERRILCERPQYSGPPGNRSCSARSPHSQSQNDLGATEVAKVAADGRHHGRSQSPETSHQQLAANGRKVRERMCVSIAASLMTCRGKALS